MNALKAHNRHLADLAEQERKLEQERIANMTPEERIEYEKEQKELRKRLKDHLDALAISASLLSSTPYGK